MRPITELTGRYHLEELIAAGGMGEVWRAADQVLARPVAVKLLRPEYTHDEVTLARFRAEAQHAGLLNHPGIAQVYDYRDAGPESPAYLVMELVAGPSLAAVLASGRLEPARSADVMAQAAAALGAAHAAGVLHRDIKPANLLITCDGQVKVTDFGIAHSARTENLTSTGALIGTMGYLAPERVSGSSATAASDLYALGIVGYECLTGQPPFRGEPLQVALAHRDQDLPEFPPWCLRQPGGGELAALIADLTAKDPAARPATAAEVAARARHIRDGLTGRPGVSAAPSPAAPSPAAPSPAGPLPGRSLPRRALPRRHGYRDDTRRAYTWQHGGNRRHHAQPGTRRRPRRLRLAISHTAPPAPPPGGIRPGPHPGDHRRGPARLAARAGPALPGPARPRVPRAAPDGDASPLSRGGTDGRRQRQPGRPPCRRGPSRAAGAGSPGRGAHGTGQAGSAGHRVAAPSHRPGPFGQRDPGHRGHPAGTRPPGAPRPSTRRPCGPPGRRRKARPAWPRQARQGPGTGARLTSWPGRPAADQPPGHHRFTRKTPAGEPSARTVRDDESVRCQPVSSAPAGTLARQAGT